MLAPRPINSQPFEFNVTPSAKKSFHHVHVTLKSWDRPGDEAINIYVRSELTGFPVMPGSPGSPASPSLPFLPGNPGRPYSLINISITLAHILMLLSILHA